MGSSWPRMNYILLCHASVSFNHRKIINFSPYNTTRISIFLPWFYLNSISWVINWPIVRKEKTDKSSPQEDPKRTIYWFHVVVTLRRMRRRRIWVGSCGYCWCGRTWLNDVLNWCRVAALVFHLQLNIVIVTTLVLGRRIRMAGHLLLSNSFLFPEFCPPILEPNLKKVGNYYHFTKNTW